LLDKRGLDPRWGGLTGVEIEIDPITEVEVLISGGEGAATEFKRQLPSDERSIVMVMKTVAAFSNGDGGSLLFGVENDGTICGVASVSRDDIDRLTSLVSSWLRPRPEFDVTAADVDGKDVLILRVGSGPEPPYGVGTTDDRVRYYVRRSGTTSPATPADVRAAVRARLPSPNQAGIARLVQ
jgi:predicted HTH transcriptional regulator